MWKRFIPRSMACAWAIVLTASLSAGAAPATVVDVIGHLSNSEFASYIAPQSYRDWGDEPCIAVNPLNPQEIIISSFGYGSWVSSSTAQLWYSTNAGASWGIRFSVPTPFPGSTFFVDDQTYAYDNSGVLHAAMYARNTAGSDFVYHGTTTNLNSAAAWNWNATALTTLTYTDQPWIALSGSTVAVAYDNFNSSYTFSEERVAISTDSGATFTSGLDKAVCSPGRVNTSITNPGLRIAADVVGHLFIICGIRTNNDASGVPLINYRLNRYSGGTNWDFTTATPDAIGGLAITNGPSRQGNSSAFSFGGINFLLGNITAIAANTNGSRVYVAYGLSDTNKIGHLFLQKFQASGTNLVMSGSPLTVSATNFSAALPSIAIANNGTLGVLFDEFDGTNFHVHFVLSLDEGASIATNMELYAFATNGMVFSYGTTNHNRLLGDFGYMLANNDTFYGTFAARGSVSAGSMITTNLIVPFFFSLDASFTQPSIIGVARLSDGDLLIDFRGRANVTYCVQATTNLSPPGFWQTLSTNVADVNGRWSYTDVTTNSPQRFYRASLLP